MIEDFERLSELDKMYLQEHEYQMICDWQQYEEQKEKLPAEITLKSDNKVKSKKREGKTN